MDKVHDQSGETYNTNKQIRFKTSVIRSNLCDYRDAYVVVKAIVTVSADERDRGEMNRQVTLKNGAEKGLRLVSPPHFVYDFSRKMFLMLHYIN